MGARTNDCWNEYLTELEDDEDYSQLTFYHGTSDVLDISHILPAIESGVLREEWRTKLTDKIFLTDSLYAAGKYAKKACEKYGGNPIVYVVQPVGCIWKTGKNEFVADQGEILAIVK